MVEEDGGAKIDCFGPKSRDLWVPGFVFRGSGDYAVDVCDGEVFFPNGRVSWGGCGPDDCPV